MNKDELQQFNKFNEDFKGMCERGEFYKEISSLDVQWLIDLIIKINNTKDY